MAFHLMFVVAPVEGLEGHDPNCVLATESKLYRKPVRLGYRFDKIGNGRVYKLESVGFDVSPGASAKSRCEPVT